MPTQRALVLSLALFALPALAVEPELAAENYLTEVNSNTHVGGAASVRFAQVFEVFDTGPLSHLMLPVGCDPGATLVVTIEEAPGGQPGGSVLARQNVPGHALDAVARAL